MPVSLYESRFHEMGTVSVCCHSTPRTRHIIVFRVHLGKIPMPKAAVRPLPEAGTYNNVMLAQHGHLPQRLVGESVKVVGPVLPPAPALLPARMYQLLCKQAWNPAWVRAPGTPF